MKKLLILMLVLGMASVVNATTLTWSDDAITIPSISATVVVTLNADDDQPYDWKWVGQTAGASPIGTISAMSTRASAGPDGGFRTPADTTFPGWWKVRALDLAAPYTIESGAQFDVTIKALAVGIFGLASDGGGQNDILEVTVVPEPMTIALLGLGSLALLRRRKK